MRPVICNPYEEVGDTESNGALDLVVAGAGGWARPITLRGWACAWRCWRGSGFPHHGVCGDCMLARTASEMERLGLGDWLLETRHGGIEGSAVRTKPARFEEALSRPAREPRRHRPMPEFEPEISERVLAAGWAQEPHRRRDFSAALLPGYSRQLRQLRSVRQTSTHALVTPTSTSRGPC